MYHVQYELAVGAKIIFLATCSKFQQLSNIKLLKVWPKAGANLYKELSSRLYPVSKMVRMDYPENVKSAILETTVKMLDIQ